MTTIPWSKLVTDGVVTDRQADELAEVIVRTETGAWVLNGFWSLTDDQREAVEDVIRHVCNGRETVQ